MDKKPLIDIFVNKHFEVEPFIAALMTLSSHYQAMPFPTKISIPTTGINRMRTARASYRIEGLNIDFDVWCIEDLMYASVSGSNSEEKYKVLPEHIKQQNPDFVISVSTAESTPRIQLSEDKSYNGSVLMGGNFYMFDAHNYDPDSMSHLIINKSIFINNVKQILYDTASKITTDGFYEQITAPANPLVVWAEANLTSVGVVNIENYPAYHNADPAAYDAFNQNYGQSSYIPATIETTHGIVKMSVDKVFSNNTVPTLFVSPITDRYKYFNEDVGTNGIQNYIAGYNAGIAVGKLLMAINDNPSLI